MRTLDLMKSAMDYHQPARFLLRSARNLVLARPASQTLRQTILIEPTSICNARCVFCSYRFGFRDRASLTLDQFRELCISAVEVGYRCCNLTSPGGELLVHRDALALVATAKMTGFDHVGFYTNGILLSKHGVRQVLTSGVDAILISFPGFDKQTYASIFGVDKFDEFAKSVTELLRTHREIGSEVSIMLEPRCGSSYRAITADPFYLEHVRPYLGDSVTMSQPLRRFDNWGGVITKADMPPGAKLDSPVPLKSIGPLRRPALCERLYLVGVGANGVVRLCNCRHGRLGDRDELRIAVVSDYPDLKTLLDRNQDKIRRIRDRFRHGELPSICRTCSLYKPTRSAH